MSPHMHATVWLFCAVGWAWIYAVTSIAPAMAGSLLSLGVGMAWLFLPEGDD